MPANRAGAAGPAERVSAQRGKQFVTEEVMISERPAEAEDRAVPGPLGRRSDPRTRPLGDRHAGGALKPLHDAAAPPAAGGPPAASEERAAGLRSRRRGRPRRDRRRDHDAARAAAPVADLGPGRRDGPARHSCGSRPGCRSTSAIRRARGSAAPTRTPTGCCASTSREAPISPDTAPRTSPRSPQRSTAGRARRSAGGPQPRSSTSTSPRAAGMTLTTRRARGYRRSGTSLRSGDLRNDSRVSAVHHRQSRHLLHNTVARTG